MKMKKTKRLLSLLLAFILTVATMVPVMAADNVASGSAVSILSKILPIAVGDNDGGTTDREFDSNYYNDSTSTDGSITMKLPEGSKATSLGDMHVDAYRMLKQVEVKQSGAISLVPTEGFKAFFAEAKRTYMETTPSSFYVYYDEDTDALAISTDEPSVKPCIDIANANIDKEFFSASLMEHLLNNASDTGVVAEWARKYVAKNKAAINGANYSSKDANNASEIALTNLNLGYWVVLSSKAPAGIANVKTIMKLTDSNAPGNIGGSHQVNAEFKLQEQGLTKEVRNDTIDEEDFHAATSASVKDTLEYQITFNLQDLKEYDRDDYTFTLTDTIHNQVINENSFTIELEYNNSEVYLDEQYYTLTCEEYNEEEGTQKYTIVFKEEKIRELTPSILGYETVVTVKYKAELMDEVALRNINSATWSYSNDPNDAENVRALSGEATVYSYGLRINKKFSGADNATEDELKALNSKVRFELYYAERIGDEVEQVGEDPIEFVGSTGEYYVADSQDEGKNTIYTELRPVQKSGRIQLYGLRAGYYILKETATAFGYQLAGEIVVRVYEDGTFELMLGDPDGCYAKENHVWLNTSTYHDGNKWTDATHEYLVFDVLNQKGFPLPGTGAMGVWLFGICGMLLIVVTRYVRYTRRKKNEA